MPGRNRLHPPRSGVGKSVSLQILMGFLKADSGTVIVAAKTSPISPENQTGGHPKESQPMVFRTEALSTSLTVARTWRFRCAKAGELSVGADLPDRRWPAADGGTKGNARPFALGSLDRDEALCGHCPRSGGTAECVRLRTVWNPPLWVDP